MPTVRDLRDRIRSLTTTQQITRATGAVAASRIRAAKIRFERSRPYAEAFAGMLNDLIGYTTSIDDPLTKPGKAGAPLGAIVMTSDRGLAGAFNLNLIHCAKDLGGPDANVRWYNVGVKGRNALRYGSDPTAAFWPLTSGDMSATARAVSEQTAADFTTGAISAVVLISPKLASVLSQPPQTRTLLPIVPKGDALRPAAQTAVEFSPSPQAVLSQLFPKHLEMTIYSAMLETQACYYAAQLMAMHNATENAGKLIDELTLRMNKVRQESITTELVELASGAEARKRR